MPTLIRPAPRATLRASSRGAVHWLPAALCALVLAACGRVAVTSSPTPEAASAAEASAAAAAAMPARLPLATFDSAWAIIERTYWEPTYNGVNWTALRDSLRPRAAAAVTQQQLRNVLQTMVQALKQSHFSIIPAEVSDVASGVSSDGDDSREGQIGLSVRWIDRELIVANVRADSPAARLGLRPGWRVIAIDDDTIATRIRALPETLDPRRVALSAFALAERALAGTPGTSVSVRVQDANGAERTLVAEREPVPGTIVKFGNLPPQHALLEWERHQVADKTIGVIRFNIWMPVLVREFDIAMDSLRGSDGIIVDIRSNFGGVVGMAMGIAGHFMDTTLPVGLMKTRAQDLKFAINPRRVNTANERVTPYAGPLALLVDELSVSTSEIFAGGLADLGRAHIVGSQTAGQALPAVAERLPNGDILYHAIADFLSPSGARLEGDGVLPQLPVRLTRETLLNAGDPALEAALRWISTAPAWAGVTGTRVSP